MCDLPQTTTSALRAPQSIMGSAGPSRPNRAQNHTTGGVPVEWEAVQVPSWLPHASSPNAAPRPQTPVSGRGNGVAGSPGGETGPKDSYSTRHRNVDAVGKPGHITHNRGAAQLGSGAQALILGPTVPHLGLTGKQQRIRLCLLLPSSCSGILSKSPCTSAPQSPGV